MIKQPNLNRRLFLRGLGGAVVAAPFLSSVAERVAKAQGVPSSGPSKRLIVLFTHYGCVTNKWFPANSHGALQASDLTGTSLAPLSPYVNKLLLPRGMRNMNEWNMQMSRGQGNDPHTQVAGSYFSCQPVTPHNDMPVIFNDAKNNAWPVGPSLDHVCAEQISPTGIPLFMRPAGSMDNGMSSISYSGADSEDGNYVKAERYAGLDSATQIYSDLTGLFMSGGDPNEMTPDDYAAIKGKSIIDLVRGDLTTLESFDMSAADKDKLEAWKALLDDTNKPIASAQCNAETADLLGLSTEVVGAVGGGGGLGGGDRLTKKIGNIDVADVFSNLAVLSVVCEANRVVFMKYPSNYIYSGLGLDMENHSMSHRIGNATMNGKCQPDILAKLEVLDKYHAEKFAFLVGQLDKIAEGEGTVLDNCAAIMFNELSDGNAHNLNNMPVVQAGSCGGYFKQGQAVNVFDGTSDLSPGRSDSLCKNGAQDNVDGTTQSTGTEASIGTAPINKYYCNIMNALGMKGDATTGYATVGGTAEITHFGRWDDTADFKHGGTDGTPRNIKDPGGFDALKANP
jgi:hypothetical protein